MTEKNVNWLKYHFAGYFSLILIFLPIMICLDMDLGIVDFVKLGRSVSLTCCLDHGSV